MNQKTALTIRTETLREFLEFHLDRAQESALAMERTLDSASSDGIKAHLNAVNEAAIDLQYHLGCVTGVLTLFGINRQYTPYYRLDIRELRNKVRNYFESGVCY